MLQARPYSKPFPQLIFSPKLFLFDFDLPVFGISFGLPYLRYLSLAKRWLLIRRPLCSHRTSCSHRPSTLLRLVARTNRILGPVHLRLLGAVMGLGRFFFFFSLIQIVSEALPT